MGGRSQARLSWYSGRNGLHGSALGAVEFEGLVEGPWLVGLQLGANVEQLAWDGLFDLRQGHLLQGMVTPPLWRRKHTHTHTYIFKTL